MAVRAMLRDLVLPHDALLLVLDRRKAEVLRNHGSLAQLVLETEAIIHADAPGEHHDGQAKVFTDEVSSTLRRLSRRHLVPGIVMIADRRDIPLVRAVRDGVTRRRTGEPTNRSADGGAGDAEDRRTHRIPGTSTFLFILTRRDGASLRDVGAAEDGSSTDA
ncbi:hypothetical protein ASF65_03995 [Aureimonas sp. Leaf324]|nr:hypothetical protein ASF65_03995 [Aureimonas sp. Leaf324]